MALILLVYPHLISSLSLSIILLQYLLCKFVKLIKLQLTWNRIILKLTTTTYTAYVHDPSMVETELKLA